MDVSIIIVNYNTKELLDQCLKSIINYTKGCSYEVIVVDNKSTDGSKDFFKKEYPNIKYIYNEENLGFGRANNVGARYASGEYLFLLNSDTILISDAISELYIKAKEVPRLGVAGCHLINSDGSSNVTFGMFPSIKEECHYIIGKIKGIDYKTVVDREKMNVDFVAGADMMIPRNVYEEMHGFDENIFLYFEETDLQKRMALNGFKRVIFADIDIIHLDGGSFDGKGLTFRRFKFSYTSYNYYLRKYYSGFFYVTTKLFSAFLRIPHLFRSGWTWSERLESQKLTFGNWK